MDEKDRSELILAFVGGAVLGVGVALLFRPAPSRRALARRIAQRARHSGEQWRDRAGRAGRRAEEAGSALARASHEVLDQFREEVGEIVGAAREELAREIYAQLRGGRGARRSRHSRQGRR